MTTTRHPLSFPLGLLGVALLCGDAGEFRGSGYAGASLAIARDKVPGATFHRAGLTALPAADAYADLVVCALALPRLPDLRPVFAELARVLRPGGRLITSDIHRQPLYG